MGGGGTGWGYSAWLHLRAHLRDSFSFVVAVVVCFVFVLLDLWQRIDTQRSLPSRLDSAQLEPLCMQTGAARRSAGVQHIAACGARRGISSGMGSKHTTVT